MAGKPRGEALSRGRIERSGQDGWDAAWLADHRRLRVWLLLPDKSSASRDCLDPLRLRQGWATACLHSHLGGGRPGLKQANNAMTEYGGASGDQLSPQPRRGSMLKSKDGRGISYASTPDQVSRCVCMCCAPSSLASSMPAYRTVTTGRTPMSCSVRPRLAPSIGRADRGIGAGEPMVRLQVGRRLEPRPIAGDGLLALHDGLARLDRIVYGLSPVLG